MSSDATVARIKRLMVEHVRSPVPWETVDGDFPLLEKSVVDSLEMLQLVSAIEVEFGIEIDDDDIVPDNWRTIRNIAGLIEAKQA